jgi:hypothetical protein
VHPEPIVQMMVLADHDTAQFGWVRIALLTQDDNTFVMEYLGDPKWLENKRRARHFKLDTACLLVVKYMWEYGMLVRRPDCLGSLVSVPVH